MMPNKVLYTDGHEVTVTDSFFKVKKSLYRLNGITKHGLSIVYPDRLIPLMMVLTGAILAAMGVTRLIPPNLVSDVEFYSFIISANTMALLTGLILLLAGLLILWLVKERYAIRISTAEGEKNVIISPKKEYIAQIEDALNHAFFELISMSRKREKKQLNK